MKSNYAFALLEQAGLNKQKFCQMTSTPRGTLDGWFAYENFPGWFESWMQLYIKNKDLEATVRVLNGIQNSIQPYGAMESAYESTVSKRKPNAISYLIDKNVLKDGDLLSFTETKDTAVLNKAKKKLIWKNDNNLYSASDLAKKILNYKGSLRGTEYWRVDRLDGKTIVELFNETWSEKEI